MFTHFLGHGDSRQIILLPGSVEECFEYGWRAFDYAEQLQTPVFVLSDLDIGMNNWMAEPFQYPTEPMNRGKVLSAEQLTQFIEEKGKWGRYMDADADGIPYRTLPGTNHPRSAWFARGTGHNEMATYSERGDDWVKNMARLHKKFETARATLPAPEVDWNREQPNKVGILTFGSNHDAVREVRDWLRAKHGIETDYLRVKALPLHADVKAFLEAHDVTYVVENDFDGQMNQVINVDYPETAIKRVSLALGDSLPMTPEWLFERITSHMGK